jgi:hypothetical protein
MRRVLVVVVVVLVAVGAYLIGRLDSGREVTPTAAPSDVLPDVSALPGASPIPAGATQASLNVSARGVGVEAPVVGLTKITIDGGRLSFHGELADGRSASVQTQAGRLTFRGPSLSLHGTSVVGPSGVRFSEGAIAPEIRTSGVVTVLGDLTLNIDNRSSQVSEVRITPSMPISLGSFTDIASMRWLDAPAQLRVRTGADERGRIDWAGSGSVRTSDTTRRVSFGALAGRRLDVTVRRAGGKLTLTGSASVEQLYHDGAPVFATRATVDLVRARVTAPAGRRAEVVWAPRNLGRFDMAMTRIRPMTPSARWLHLGLAPLPSTFGGEERPARGGNTEGFMSGGAIRSIIVPGEADRRDITVEVPAGTRPGTYEAVVLVEGNFDDVEVRFEIDVA